MKRSFRESKERRTTETRIRIVMQKQSSCRSGQTMTEAAEDPDKRKMWKK